jgi:hypothetical protein
MYLGLQFELIGFHTTSAGTSACDTTVTTVTTVMIDNSAADVEPLTFTKCWTDALVPIAGA